MRKPDPNISISNPPCSECNQYFVNLSIHKGRKHKIYSQSKIAIRIRKSRALKWLKSKLRNIEN